MILTMGTRVIRSRSPITGKAFWIPLVIACIRFCYRAYQAARGAYSAYRAARAVRQTYVIGRNMGRVTSYARAHGYRTYRPINGRVYQGMSRVNQRWAERVSFRHNRRWIRRVTRRGHNVVDIGRGSNSRNGVYYGMERHYTRGYSYNRRAY